MSHNPETPATLTNPDFPRHSHQIKAVYGPDNKLINYRVTTPSGNEFEVEPNHPFITKIAETVLMGAEDLDQTMLPIYLGTRVIDYLRARGFAEEDIPTNIEDALNFVNNGLKSYNEAEKLVTEGKIHTATQALVDKYIMAMSMPWWDYVKLSPTLRGQLSIIGQALTAKALQHAGVDKATLETSKIALEITKNNAAIAKLAAGIIKTIEELANSTINVGAKAINTTAGLVPVIGKDIGEGVGRTIGGAVGGVIDQFNRSKKGSDKDVIDTQFRPINPRGINTQDNVYEGDDEDDDEDDDFLG